MNNNRRNYFRLKSDEPCEVEIDRVRYPARLVDESIGGMCVGGLPITYLYQNQPVTVLVRGERTTGICKSILRDSPKTFQLGLDREAEQANQYNQLLLNSFIPFGDFKLVCERLERFPDDQLRIRLINGKEFFVPQDQIQPILRDEREKELGSSQGDQLRDILEVYSAMTGYQYRGISEVLETEFGKLSKVPV